MAVEPDKTGGQQGRRNRSAASSRRSPRRKRKPTASGPAAESPVDAESGKAPAKSSKKATRSTRRKTAKKTAAGRPKENVESAAEFASAAPPSDGGATAKVKDLVTVAKPVQTESTDGAPAAPAEAPTGRRKRRRAARGTRKKQARRHASSPKASTEDGADATPPTREVPEAPPDGKAAEPKAPPRRRRKRRTRRATPEEPAPEPAADAAAELPVSLVEGDGFGVGLFDAKELAEPAEAQRGRVVRAIPVEREPRAKPTVSEDRAGEPRVRDEAPAHDREDEARRADAAPKRKGRARAKRAAAKGQAPRAAPSKESPPAKVAEAGPSLTDLDMIINVSAGDECRIAVLESGRLEELFIERQSAESHVGSIYKGKVTNVEPSIQAVFVDFGLAKNGFLHISDVHPQYFPDRNATSEGVGKKIPRRDRPPIQKCFRRGQEVVVQVTKEGIGTKGPTLTTYLSIPGRFLVMMPGMTRLGVSRKIEDEDARRSMRELLGQLDLPEGMGFILRTAGLDRTKRELQRDLTYLSRLWKIVSQRIHKAHPPAEVYQESDLVIRTIRDVLTSDFKRIVVDHEPTAEKAREFLKIALPRSQDMVEVHDQPQPIFHHYGIEEEIERINARHVPLRSGGSIVIEPTEAMVAIDVNSGRFREVEDAEQSAFQINQEAAEEIARQLRLRDLGGLIVCDFIDMRLERHKRVVERCLRNALKKHKERVRLLRMSAFGLIEITRQRQRTSIRRSIYTECPHCRGSGIVKSAESMALEVMRVLQLVSHQKGVRKVAVTVSSVVAFLVQNQRRARLHELEVETGASITIRGEPQYALDQMTCECEDARGRSVMPSI